MLIKAVYTVLSSTVQEMRSFATNPFTVLYRPGEWIKPILKGSGLFCFADITTALRTFPPKRLQLPYRGPTYWYCEYTGGRVPRYFMRDPLWYDILYYWDMERLSREDTIEKQYPYAIKGIETVGWCVVDSLRMTEPIDMETLDLHRQIDYA